MKTSSLEITDQEYLIKLSKEEFDLAFINQLLKRIQDEQLFFNKRDNFYEEENVRDRAKYDPSLRFDHLRDK